MHKDNTHLHTPGSETMAGKEHAAHPTPPHALELTCPRDAAILAMLLPLPRASLQHHGSRAHARQAQRTLLSPRARREHARLAPPALQPPHLQECLHAPLDDDCLRVHDEAVDPGLHLLPVSRCYLVALHLKLQITPLIRLHLLCILIYAAPPARLRCERARGGRWAHLRIRLRVCFRGISPLISPLITTVTTTIPPTFMPPSSL